MSKILSNLKYTKEHEWTLIEGDLVTVGITDFAQSALGDIVFTELPSVGSAILAGSTFGVVESIKSVSDLFSPVSGTVVEVNSEVESSPEKLNENPYGSWLIKVRIQNPSELDSLMSPEEYQQHIEVSH